MIEPLPIDPFVPAIVEAARAKGAVVVVAAPGAGKTTRVPPALTALGPAILLQPRRVAARAIARRIAAEQGWTLGEEVGWQVRFERRFSPRTRLLVATEGVLTGRLQADPLLSGFRTVILDEFHERSIHADLALALARQAARARDDLALVVMSATLDAAAVSDYLGGAPVVDVPGRLHPVTIQHAAGETVAAAVRRVLARPGGHVLAFLPGAPEIYRTERELSGMPNGVRVLPLHGRLDADAQDLAVAPSADRKAILSTNIAETSLTVEGVTDVVDSGLHRVMRYDTERALDRLDTERIPADAAAQRAGRAGRTAPGRCLRLWDPRDRLRPHREPDVARIDLAGPLLDILAWGGDPLSFEWFEAPPPDRVAAALQLLADLGLVAGRQLTPRGEAVRGVSLPPRLATVLVAAGGTPRAAAACAFLSEPLPARGPADTTRSDVLLLVDRLAQAPGHIRQAARELADQARRVAPSPGLGDDDSLLRAILAGFPDRVARRREPGSPRLVLASGHGAVLSPESGVRDADLLVALDVQAGARGPGSEALVRLASGIEREWLPATRRETTHAFDPDSSTVRAVERAWYRDLVLWERPTAPDPEEAGRVLAEALLARGLGEENEMVRRRLRFAGLEADVEAAVRLACTGRTSAARLDLREWLPAEVARALDRLAPVDMAVPSGRRARLEYREDGTVSASVKLQELFGLAETPRVGPRQEPVLLELLAPNGRPVQTTRDLRSFWDRTYPEVRKELRGRYPRHPWPEDPWTAPATHRAKPRR